VNIIKVLTDKNLFAPLFKDPSRWHAWEVYLRGLFGLPIANKKDLALFKKCTGFEYKPGGGSGNPLSSPAGGARRAARPL